MAVPIVKEDKYTIKCRNSKTCVVCGSDKDHKGVMCWTCYKYNNNPYKYSELSLQEYVKKFSIIKEYT